MLTDTKNPNRAIPISNGQIDPASRAPRSIPPPPMAPPLRRRRRLRRIGGTSRPSLCLPSSSPSAGSPGLPFPRAGSTLSPRPPPTERRTRRRRHPRAAVTVAENRRIQREQGRGGKH